MNFEKDLSGISPAWTNKTFFMGRLEMWLAVAVLDIPKRVPKLKEWIYVPYGMFAPARTAYQQFDSYPELETCIRANFYIYQLVREALEPALVAALSEQPA